MDAVTAAVVAAWLVLIVLAFAMAGLLHQLRDLRAAIVRQVGADELISNPADLPAAVKPRADNALAAVLLVDDRCPICAEVTPIFADVASEDTSGLEFVVLISAAASNQEIHEGVRYVVDSSAYRLLDPGWRPALIGLDAKGKLLMAEPAGSEEAVRELTKRLAGSTVGKR